MHTPRTDQTADPGFRHAMDDALRYWEIRRAPYNLVLVAVTVFWCAWTWPHFRPALTGASLLKLLVLALLANVCYTAAYVVDLPMQLSSYRSAWYRKRWILWVVGTAFAALLATYWIGDEIYPDFP